MEKAEEGTHKHRCDHCGTIWEHSDDLRGSYEAHLCPKEGCGEHQGFRFTTDEEWNDPMYVDFRAACKAEDELTKTLADLLGLKVRIF